MQVAMNPQMPLLTVDEARRKWFDLGPMPVEEMPEETEEDNRGQERTEEDTGEERKAELKKWERKARRSLKESGAADAPFAATTIPPGVAEAIRHRLVTAKTPEEVKAAFIVAPF